MCGRYTITKPERLAATFAADVIKAETGKPRYNVAPMQKAPVVAVVDGRRLLADIQWGFMPPWASEPSMGKPIINARCETIAVKPAFRESFRTRRCLVPADGFYEWQKAGDERRPFYFRLGDGEPFAFTGLYSIWTGKDKAQLGGLGGELFSFAIATTQANEIMSPVHDRMPVILPRQHWDAWLDPENGNVRELNEMLVPFDGRVMSMRPVSRLVNSPANDTSGCIEPEG